MSPLRCPAKAKAPRSLIAVSIRLAQRCAWARRRTRATVQKPFQRRGEAKMTAEMEAYAAKQFVAEIHTLYKVSRL
jgi:hypothetical protein